MMTEQKKLPQDVWEAVIAMANAMRRKASAEGLSNLDACAATRQAQTRPHV